MIDNSLLDSISEKYRQMGEDPEVYLKGLLHAKPINYWDYVEVETLLSLQKPRTEFKDELIFVMYHQVTELVLKMMRHEIEQLVYDSLDEPMWIEKMSRLNRYTELMINSFDVMKCGMNYDDYNAFRHSLTPASGFQSAQFRFIEILCTRLSNLVQQPLRGAKENSWQAEDYFEHIYWKSAGIDRKTGEKSHTLKQFEAKYLEDLIALSKNVKGQTLEEQLMNIAPTNELITAAKKFDHLYNVSWPLVHIQTAQHYLESKDQVKKATGSSDWKKYLHPRHQQRRFFPQLWGTEELERWGDEASAQHGRLNSTQID